MQEASLGARRAGGAGLVPTLPARPAKLGEPVHKACGLRVGYPKKLGHLQLGSNSKDVWRMTFQTSLEFDQPIVLAAELRRPYRGGTTHESDDEDQKESTDAVTRHDVV